MTNVIYDSTTVATVGYVETKEQRAIYNRRAREKHKAYVEGLETEIETLKKCEAPSGQAVPRGPGPRWVR